jgi:cytochrome c
LGLAVAPDFAADPWVYVYYSPPLNTPLNNAPDDGNEATFQPYVGENRLSRFRFDGNQLVLGSEQTILRVRTDRGHCCHTGGNIDFDGAGNLYLSTGDDSNPFRNPIIANGGNNNFTPIDERPNRAPALDAQRSSGNTNDLRGKLLRIRVQPDGSVTIPEGNLFPEGTANTRPEIYAMGLRNPYRFAVNRANGEVYVADYAPDARQADPTRGPAGTGKWLVVRGAANYGWPYCVGHLAYVDYNFATNTPGAPFDCDNLRNDSPRNDGLVELPPVTDPELLHPFGAVPGFPDLGNQGSLAPMAGPMYVFDPPSTSPIKWPAEYDGGIMFYEWTRNLIADFRLGADGSLASATRLPIPSIIAPIDMEFGPDGALYLLEYGSSFGGPADDASLSRIEYRVQAPPEPDPNAPQPGAEPEGEESPIPTDVAFSDVFPILSGSCTPCHATPGSQLPAFAQEDADAAYQVTQEPSSFANVLIGERIIVRGVGEGTMPPACGGGMLGAEGCLSERDAAVLEAWIDQGARR